MCGICGKVLNRGDGSQDLLIVANMNETLVHRGPDDGGVYYACSAALGHRRLSIIDLDTGQQPMYNEDRTIAVVFNGEIYNYLELRDELVSAGHHFVSRSDTEVIVHLYEEMGPDCVNSLRGMFALAIWDARRQQLTLARDRLGQKPLFYAPTGDGLIFASELKALIQAKGWDRAIDPSAAAIYLELGYIPAPYTIFREVRKLKPGHLLTWRKGDLQIQRYWSLTWAPKIPASNEQKLMDELDARLRDAVRIRLMSDVPLGAFLSGGIDSSLVVAIMADMMDEPVRTFAIGFEQETHNELPYARQVAERFATRHTEFVVRADAVEILPKLVWHFDEPFADPSALPTYYLSSLAREHVTVTLNGDGGDELFGGYLDHRSEWFSQVAARFPRVARSTMLGLLSHLPPGNETSPQARLQRILTHSFLEMKQRYAGFHCLLSLQQRRNLCRPEFLTQIDDIARLEYMSHKLAPLPGMDDMDPAFAVDLDIYLPDDLLVKVDRMTMANSLEARSPFLDQELAAWAVRLPLSYKLRGTTTKYLLRRLAARYLPRGIVNREKHGFSVPLDDWFRGELKELAHDALLSQRSKDRGYFKPDQVRKLLDNHQTGCRFGKQIWMLLMFELWHQQFVDGPVSLGTDAVRW